MTKLTVNASRKYGVYVEENIINKIGERIKAGGFDGKKIAVIYDAGLSCEYLSTLMFSLKESGFEVNEKSVLSGEKCKTAQALSDILSFLFDNGFCRSDALISLGGGSTGDLCSLAASLYKRGMHYYCVPTTLVSAVDASVGGKNAIDFHDEKNSVGTFYQPHAVFIDTDIIASLPTEQTKNGISEIIKYACIFDASFFKYLEKNEFNKLDLEKVIIKCLKYKKKVIEKDEHDKGERMLLNFGHTFGHAIEKLSDFKIEHGRAVALGMLIAFDISKKLFNIGDSQKSRLALLLEKNGIDTDCPFALCDILSCALGDKKAHGDRINVILLKKIGKAKVCFLTFDEFLSCGK